MTGTMHFSKGVTALKAVFPKDGSGEAFASLDLIEGGPTRGTVALIFYSVEDIAKVAAELYQLGRDFAEKIGPDDAEVPLFEADVGAMVGAFRDQFPESAAAFDGWADQDIYAAWDDATKAKWHAFVTGREEAAPVTELLIGGGVPRIEGEAE